MLYPRKALALTYEKGYGPFSLNVLNEKGPYPFSACVKPSAFRD